MFELELQTAEWRTFTHFPYFCEPRIRLQQKVDIRCLRINCSKRSIFAENDSFTSTAIDVSKGDSL